MAFVMAVVPKKMVGAGAAEPIINLEIQHPIDGFLENQAFRGKTYCRI